jgi:protease I
MDTLGSAGIEVKIASNAPGVAHGVYGGSVKTDIVIGDAKVGDFDAIVFVGGPGSSVFWNDRKAHEIANDAVKDGKVLAAICIAPVTLANAGVLKGKRATVWLSEGKALKAKGADFTGNGVEVDGRIVTAVGPQNAAEFAAAVLKKLKE